jgi:hypothetical protein
MADPVFSTTAVPRYPEKPGREHPELVQRTWGGGVRASDLSLPATTYQTLTVAYRGLSRTQWDAMVAFFGTTVQWSALTFTWVDPFSVTHTGLRYLSGIAEARSRNMDRWDVDLVFATDAGA